VNGEAAELGQFPYQVLWAFGNSFCGGSIYNKSTIITSAHCCTIYEYILDGMRGEFVNKNKKATSTNITEGASV
jgi:secreted trypsin-like serine protease